MFHAAIEALAQFAQPGSALFLMLGVASGLLVGLLPGLGGTVAVALLLPYIFILDLPAEHGLPLLVGAVASVHHSDVIASILLGVPGSAAASVTMMDGHKMAEQGRATQALSAAFLSSAAGGILGAIGLTFTIPIARPVVLSFGSPEIFMLAVLGISMAALISSGNVLRGLVSAVLGLLLGFVGSAPAEAVYRYTFGSIFLLDGFSLATVAMGIFGVAEIAYLIARKTAIAGDVGLRGSKMDGVRDFIRHWQLVLRGALVGIWAGVLPGVGATAGAFMAYGQAMATAKDKRRFGKGDVRGVIAPESAANSCESGDLIPTLLFGIPGGAPAALLLGAMLYYGFQPGPQLMNDHLNAVYVIIWSFALASVIASLLCFPLARVLARLTTIPLVRVAPVLLLIIFLGSFQSTVQFGELIAVLGIGILGYLMKQTDYPRAPLLIGFVLSDPLERYYFLTDRLYSPSQWLVRPLVLVMFAVLLVPIVMAVVRALRARRRVATPAGTPDAVGVGALAQSTESGPVDSLVPDEPGAARKHRATPAGSGDAGLEDSREGDELDSPAADEPGAMAHPAWSVGFTAVATAVIAACLVRAFEYPSAAGLAPKLVGVVGLVCVVPILVQELRTYRRRRRSDGHALWNGELSATALAFGWMVLLVVLTHYIDLIWASVVCLPIFLRFIAHMRWISLIAYTIIVAAIVTWFANFAHIALPTGSLL